MAGTTARSRFVAVIARYADAAVTCLGIVGSALMMVVLFEWLDPKLNPPFGRYGNHYVHSDRELLLTALFALPFVALWLFVMHVRARRAGLPRVHYSGREVARLVLDGLLDSFRRHRRDDSGTG